MLCFSPNNTRDFKCWQVIISLAPLTLDSEEDVQPSCLFYLSASQPGHTHKFTQQQEKDVPTLTTQPPGKRPLATLLLPLPKSHFFINMQVRQHKVHKMPWPGSTDEITGLNLNTECSLFFFYNSK